MSVAPTASANQTVISLCERAAVINGVPQKFVGVGNGPLADTCTFREIGFETFTGPTVRVSEEFPNCPPDTFEDGSVAVAFERGIAQVTGDYKFTQAGVAGGMLGAVNGSWKKHTGALDLTLDTVTARDNSTWPLPGGKVLHVTFTPKMQRMTGEWHVYTKRVPGGMPGGDPIVIHDLRATQEVVGPVVLTGGHVDGLITPVYEDC